MIGRRHPDFGYVFVADKDVGDPMLAAAPGRIVRAAGRGPPWIVVDWDLSSVLARWPGRLWRVRILEAATKRDQAGRGGEPLPSARYTRAISVRVESEEDVAQLFGESGAGVIAVLEAGLRLDRASAERLASNRNAGAAAARDRAWRTWLDRLGVAHDGHPDLSDTLKYGGAVGDSPIGDGLSALHDVVFERACAVGGESATASDEEDSWLLPPWRGAFDALADAALALGAPDIIAPDDRAVLLAGWLSLGQR